MAPVSASGTAEDDVGSPELGPAGSAQPEKTTVAKSRKVRMCVDDKESTYGPAWGFDLLCLGLSGNGSPAAPPA